MSRKRRRKVNATGRNAVEQFAPLTYAFLQSEAWRSLSGPAVKVWLEVRSRYNGGNNGKLFLSLDEAAKLLRIGKGTAQRAFVELREKGFLVMTRQGQWYGRTATLWRITDRSCDGHPATNDWKQWIAPKKQSLGIERGPSSSLTAPLQDRSTKSWSATVPVRPH
mgnify:CR=1 FL=1